VRNKISKDDTVPPRGTPAATQPAAQ
jgi:hypothetical protein